MSRAPPPRSASWGIPPKPRGRRRRGPGHDWVVVKLATEGRIRRVELDTNHFKGNYPDRASLEVDDAEVECDRALLSAWSIARSSA